MRFLQKGVPNRGCGRRLPQGCCAEWRHVPTFRTRTLKRKPESLLPPGKKPEVPRDLLSPESCGRGDSAG